MKIPPYETFPQMFTDQIVLREVQSSDIKDIVEISFYDAQPAFTVERATEIQNRIDQDYQTSEEHLDKKIKEKCETKIIQQPSCP